MYIYDLLSEPGGRGRAREREREEEEDGSTSINTRAASRQRSLV